MIPENRSLEDADDKVHSLRTAVVDLVNIITDQKGVKLAGAMKLLSPFRPGFLPVIDSIVENYYWFALSMSNEAQFRQLEAAYHSTWGDYVWFLLDLMRNDIIVARAEIDRVRAAFSEKPLASISRVRVLESLIWYYYARGRYQGD
jgi:hypothetical protein